jgi:hypothetical protein
MDGMYDENEVVKLRRWNPWYRVAKRLLSIGGVSIEVDSDDRPFAKRLLTDASLHDRIAVSVPREAAWECASNAAKLHTKLVGSRLVTGLALHGPFWVFHTWVSMLPSGGGIGEATSRARYYFGVENSGAAEWNQWLEKFGRWSYDG